MYNGPPNIIVNRPATMRLQNPAPQQQRRASNVHRIYAQMSTKNKSFLDMHHYLKSIGVKNNKFMLTLIDPDLEGINPFDPTLNGFYKQKILRECLTNYW